MEEELRVLLGWGLVRARGWCMQKLGDGLRERSDARTVGLCTATTAFWRLSPSLS